ncbi:MAG: RNA methyltransferase [Methanomicrobiales archaeon]|nr:RNA methyltransferase [Methanomicrobiales archaeon]MDI6875144.1 RNA methyltransferase [Methanomicrobiales archaeon]
MADVEIVLVEPLNEGNVGFAARAMKNFGFEHLVLVNPCPLGGMARACASHARDVLENARIATFGEVYENSDIMVATTGEVSRSVCTSMRMPYYSPRELREILEEIGGRVAILFGRENWGLNNDEVAMSDLICTIPASEAYPILNLSHAVAIVCYELANLPRGAYPVASRLEMDHLYSHIDQFLNRIEHPAFKRENTMLMARRILARTKLTTREVSTLHGILRRAEWHINKGKTRKTEI